MDHLKAMRTLIRVVDEGSFASAARALDAAPAVVTRVIAELEEHLKVRLINRTTRRMALTDAGETYVERCRQILGAVDEADALASHASAEVQGHLRVLAPPAFAVHQLARRLPALRARYPKLTLELTVPGPVAVPDENHDVSILMVGATPLDGDFVARRVATSELIVCAAPEYLDRHGRPVVPKDLQHHEMLLPGLAIARRIVNLQRARRDASVPDGEEQVDFGTLQPALTTLHIDTTYAAALAGLGIAALPSFVVADALLENALERVLRSWQVAKLTIYAAVPTRRYMPARTRAFIDFLVESFGGHEEDAWLDAAGCASDGAPCEPTL